MTDDRTTDDRPTDDRAPQRASTGRNVALIVLGFVFLVIGIAGMSRSGGGGQTAFFAVGVTFLVIGGALSAGSRRGQGPDDGAALSGNAEEG